MSLRVWLLSSLFIILRCAWKTHGQFYVAILQSDKNIVSIFFIELNTNSQVTGMKLVHDDDSNGKEDTKKGIIMLKKSLEDFLWETITFSSWDK